MKKKLVAVAVATAVLMPVAAQAETTLYGVLDVSADAMRAWSAENVPHQGPEITPSDATEPGASFPLNYSQISSNSSHFGIKGVNHLGGDLDALYQIESFVNIEGDGGSNAVWASRNNFIGLGSHTWGAIKVGKNDTPYKVSTASMDPFSVTVGDYNAIMGNTGGDQRAEFDYRAHHAIWYESPKFGGFNFNLMYAPGAQVQNRGYLVAQGDSSCTGQNAPETRALGCNDGGWTDLYSANVNFHSGPLFVTAAAELHKKVDRGGDFVDAAGDTAPVGSEEQNESAWKIGASYTFAKVNKLSAIYEQLKRNGPANDRNRKGYYLSDVQKLGHKTDLMLAWAHAGQSDLQPNPDATGFTGPGCDAAGFCSAVNNSSVNVTKDTANMYAVGLRYHFTSKTNAYIVYAQDNDSGSAHFGLGASGHGITPTATGTAGETWKALSVGLHTSF